LKKASILIVDDNEGILETLSAILEMEGYRTDTAKNGMEAIEKSKMNFYDMALLDIRLPDVEGIKLLTKIEAIRPRIIKIIVTGSAPLENEIEALKLADAYILKPVNPENLLTIIKKKLKAQTVQTKEQNKGANGKAGASSSDSLSSPNTAEHQEP
jgi:DNA-binding NtrC family response regulator